MIDHSKLNSTTFKAERSIFLIELKAIKTFETTVLYMQCFCVPNCEVHHLHQQPVDFKTGRASQIKTLVFFQVVFVFIFFTTQTWTISEIRSRERQFYFVFLNDVTVEHGHSHVTQTLAKRATSHGKKPN